MKFCRRRRKNAVEGPILLLFSRASVITFLQKNYNQRKGGLSAG
jgi:hypothetical protein